MAESMIKRLVDLCHAHMNFYRYNFVFFTFGPLVMSGIFYAANGQVHIDYVDSLFLCYSAMSVCGLATVNLSSLTGFQQSMLFVMMLLGDTTLVSWLMVIVRRYYFLQRCHELVLAHRLARQTELSTSTEKVRVLHDTGRLQTEDERQRSVHSDSLVTSNHSMHLRSRNNKTLERTRTLEPYKQAAETFAATSMRRPSVDAPRVFPYGHLPHDINSFGDFPGPFAIIKHFFQTALPRPHDFLVRTMTIQPHVQMADQNQLPWLNFDGLKIGRNSNFNLGELDTIQLEFLGGLEYQALTALSWIVLLYFILAQLVPFIIMAAYMAATSKYDALFQSGQVRPVPKTWFVAFQVVSAYTGGGLSLCDTSAVPFINDILVCIVTVFSCLVGNMAMPIALRLFVWSLYKATPTNSNLNATLSFVLEHPRRVYLYLFASYQTWFLLLVVVAMSATEWILFSVLDLGLPVIKALTAKETALAGFFQSVTVRASGFAILPLPQLSPGILCLRNLVCRNLPSCLGVSCGFDIIAADECSVRSTNVYEEQGLGVYEKPDFNNEEEPAPVGRSRREVFSKYLRWHVRKQLAYEIYYPILGIFLICIVERGKIMDDANFAWFTVFRILFEVVSAFAGVGISLGLPYDNFSFAGSFSVLGKLIICAIMARGRLRGLPMAIDRAIMLPQARSEASKQNSDQLLRRAKTHDPNLENERPVTNSHEMLQRSKT